MSVVNMRLVSVIGFINELDSAALACASLCAFEPDVVDKFFKDANKFSPFINVNDAISYENMLNETVGKINKKISKSNNNDLMPKKQIAKYIISFKEKCDKIINKINFYNNEISLNNSVINDLKYFKNLNYGIKRFKDFEYMSVKFVKIFKPDFQKLILPESDDKFIIEKISEDNENYYCVIFISKEFENEINSVFKKIKLSEVGISNLEFTPQQEIDKLKLKNKMIDAEIYKLKDGIEKFWEHQKSSCAKVYSCLKQYEKCEQIKSFAKTYNDNFVLVGWVPEFKIQEISEKLDKISRVEYFVESGDELLKFSPPTKLKNRNIFSPFEFFVSTYGLPKYSDIDPTLFVAITYTIIFGIMFADVGQGLLLALFGLFLSKFKKIGLGKVMVTCGISSSVFGFIFGSVFGFEEALNPIYNVINFQPIRVMESPMKIIISSICIGIFCLILAMCANIYSLLKKNDALEAILSHSGACGIVLYSSLILLLLNTLSIVAVNPIILELIIILALIFIFLKEFIKNRVYKHEKISWGDYIISQFFELFEIILGYFTNTISFIRIGVFIFVHAGMMMVVFSLAKMTGQYLLTVILGNLFVTGFEALLVGMQVMRLQFCELFGRFFEGGGREFKPIIADIRILSKPKN
ncbi:MAG: hypothetical protein IJQ10_01105 [Clostridia bacterium]|nr:hypothetical protein [Clostridia bacterium]